VATFGAQQPVLLHCGANQNYCAASTKLEVTRSKTLTASTATTVLAVTFGPHPQTFYFSWQLIPTARYTKADWHKAVRTLEAIRYNITTSCPFIALPVRTELVTSQSIKLFLH
jgi:hypothetical protein